MTLGEMISAFRVDEQDTNTPYLWSDEDLIRWFNEAVEEAAIRKSLLLETLSFSLSTSDFEIALPVRIIEVRTARIVAGGQTYWLKPTDRYEQDRLNSDWRDTVERPTGFIHDDRSITLNRIVETAAVLKLECRRVPVNLMADDSDEPEISAAHHRRLDGWVRYRGRSVPDADFGDKNRAEQGLADFEDYFGRRPGADHRRNNNANRPHKVKAWV